MSTDWGSAASGKNVVMNGNRVPQIGQLSFFEYEWNVNDILEEDGLSGNVTFTVIPWLPPGPFRREHPSAGGANWSPRLQMLLGPEEYLVLTFMFNLSIAWPSTGSRSNVNPLVTLAVQYLDRKFTGVHTYTTPQRLHGVRDTSPTTIGFPITFSVALDTRENRGTGITSPNLLSLNSLPRISLNVLGISFEKVEITNWKTRIAHYQGPRVINHA